MYSPGMGVQPLYRKVMRRPQFTIPEDLDKFLDREARRSHRSRSAIVRAALYEYRALLAEVDKAKAS